MSSPGFPVTSTPDPHWWRPDAPESAALPAEARVEPGEVEGGGASLAFWALIAFTFVLLIAPQNIIPALQPLRIGLIAAGTGLVALVVERLGSGRPVTRVTREVKIVVCLLAWAIATVPLSYWPGGAVEVLLDLYLKTLAIFFLIANVVSTVERLRKVAWSLTLMSIPIALTGVSNSLAGVYVHGGVGQGVKRIVGYEAALTQNPNDLALVLNLIMPLTIGLLLITPSPLLRALLFGVIGLQVVGVVVTFSRAGFLTLAATLVTSVMVFARRFDEHRWVWRLLILALVCLPLLPADYVSHLFTITDIDTDPTGSARGRWNQQVAAVEYLVTHPIVGAGIGQNVLAMNEVLGPLWLVVHSVYLQYAIDLGLPGMVMFVMLLVASVRSAGHAARHGAHDLGVLANGIRTSLLAFAVAAFFSPVAYHFHFYYFAGLAVAARAIADATAGASEPPAVVEDP